jgi:NAD-dependent dihydropyrimidine dehydrogenase PreA subunit
MTHVIAAPCVDRSDRSCVDVCPVDCITADPRFDRKFHIDPEACIDCGQCTSVCPNAAIFPLTDLPIAWAGYAWIDATWFRSPTEARVAVEELHPA